MWWSQKSHILRHNMAHTSRMLGSKATCSQAHAHAQGHTPKRAHARMSAHKQICNMYCFSAATMIRERASVLRYMLYIVCLVGTYIINSLIQSRCTEWMISNINSASVHTFVKTACVTVGASYQETIVLIKASNQIACITGETTDLSICLFPLDIYSKL